MTSRWKSSWQPHCSTNIRAIPTGSCARRCSRSARRGERKSLTLACAIADRHDELLRAYCAGQKFRFDILMDIGAYRDLHRHRRCVQIHQEYCFDAWL